MAYDAAGRLEATKNRITDMQAAFYLEKEEMLKEVIRPPLPPPGPRGFPLPHAWPRCRLALSPDFCTASSGAVASPC